MTQYKNTSKIKDNRHSCAKLKTYHFSDEGGNKKDTMLYFVYCYMLSSLMCLYFPIRIFFCVIAIFIKDKKLKGISLFVLLVLNIFMANKRYVFDNELFLLMYIIFCLIFLFIILFVGQKITTLINSKILFISIATTVIIDDFMQGKIQIISEIFIKSFDTQKILGFLISTLLCFLFIEFLYNFISLNKSCLIICNLFFLFGIVNMFVYVITGKALTFQDLYFTKTAFSVLNNVNFQLKNWIYIIISFICVILFNIIIIKSKDTPAQKSLYKKAAIVYAIIIIYILSGNKFGFVMFYNNHNVSEIVNFIISINNEPIKNIKTDGYDTNIPSFSSKNKPEEDTEVIVILNEAFTDFSIFKNFTTDEEYIPFTKEIISNYPSGITYSSSFGNNTASAELSFLTGTPTLLTAPGGELYQLYMKDKKHSIVETMKDAGFNTVGIHPYFANGYNRNTAWERYGFDKSVFIDDFKNPEYIRTFISDKSVYKKIIEQCDNDNENTFCFALTMQNHALYNEGIKTTIHETEIKNRELDEYLTIQNESDKALKMLIDHYSNSDKNVYILLFGDHQPMINNIHKKLTGDNNYAENNIEIQYAIPYFIWNNKDNKKEIPQQTSMNYLGEILLNHINIKCDWFEYTQNISKLFPVITDKFIMDDKYNVLQINTKELNNLKNEEENPYSMLKQYQVYSYEIVKDK